MCSVSLNSTVNKQLADLDRSNDKTMLEERLFKYAEEADVNKPGALDNPSCHMRRMPADLKEIRKISIGRHRIYFTGHHSQCSYQAIYIKKFKRTGEEDDDDKVFQGKLIRALQQPKTGQITCNNNEL